MTDIDKIIAEEKPKEKERFSSYQIFMIAIIAILQFTIILDFMVLSPVGVFVMKDLKILPNQFSLVVTAYAISAGVSGLATAGFADMFDRKKLLLFFYVGFMLGTVLCAIANTYEFLLAARIVTGIFGGVIGSISFAIITDLFKIQVRGRVMGFVQMAFAASQVLGIPLGLVLANHIGWHSPFWMIAGFGTAVGLVVLFKMKPITAHLENKTETVPFFHLIRTISNPTYLRAFLTTTLLATGGFMLMPFGSAFSTYNLKIAPTDLPVLYGITGIFSIVFGPLIGILSDKVGKFNTFAFGSLVSIIMVLIYTNLGVTPLYLVIILNVILFVGITSRMISSSALISAIPAPQDRGAFMSINASVQQLSGGIASAVAGLIVIQATPSSPFQHYDRLGYVVASSMVVVTVLMYMLHKMILRNLKTKAEQQSV